MKLHSSNLMKVLVTGATGLLGFNTVLQLLHENCEVNALVRNPEQLEKYGHDRLKVVQGDITDASSVEKAMDHCNYVIHCAADTRMNHLKLEDYKAVNIVGTRNIIEGCKRMAVEKLVYVSSANTLGYGNLANPGTEQNAIRFPYTKSLYAASKLKAQKLVDDAASDLFVITVHPTFMIGPYDFKPSSGKIFKGVLKKRVVFYPPGGKNFVHVNDVSRGIVQALRTGNNGSRYLLCGENWSFKNFYAEVLKIQDQRSLLIPINVAVLKLLGICGDLFRFGGLKTEVNSVNINSLLIHNYYSNQKAKNELQLSFTPVSEAIHDALTWFREENG
jgi:nucleoside-diphosphate-sugar epimerase